MASPRLAASRRVRCTSFPAVVRRVAREAGPGEERLDAAVLPAVARRRRGALLVGHPGKRVVAPLAGDLVGAVVDLAVDDDAAADAGAEDDAEDGVVALRRRRRRPRRARSSWRRWRRGPGGRAGASRSAWRGRPLSQVELAFLTSPVARRRRPGCRRRPYRCSRSRPRPRPRGGRWYRGWPRSPVGRDPAAPATTESAAKPMASVLVPPRSMPICIQAAAT